MSSPGMWKIVSSTAIGQDAQSRRRRVVAQIGARRFAGRCRTGLIGIGRCRVEDGAGEGSLLFHPPVHFVVASVARVQHALAAVDEDFEIQFQVDTGLAGILAASATSAASATTARILSCRRSGPASVVIRRCGSAGRSSRPVATARATVGVASRSGQATHRRTAFDGRKEETLLGVAHQHVVRGTVAGGSFVIQEDRRNHNRSGSLVMVVAVLGRPLRLRVMQRGRTVRPKAGSHGCQRSRRRWWMVSDDGRGFDALPLQPLEHDPPEILGCEGFQLLESSHFMLTCSTMAELAPSNFRS